MPPFSKWNPGCNCCKRILVWDVGVADRTGGPNYTFQNFESLKEFYEDQEITIDFITGEPNPPDEFYTNNPNWDPYDFAVEQNYWTGNIRDYTLIIWPYPLADTNLDETDGPCPGLDGADWPTPPGSPDHPLWGGLPEWWDLIEDGQWEGRIVWQTDGNTAFEAGAIIEIGFASNVFLNSITGFHGMLVDDGAMSDQLQFSTVAVPASSDLTEGVANTTMRLLTTSISGGEDLFLEGSANVDLRTSPTWCEDAADGSFVQGYPIGQRNRVAFPQNAQGSAQKIVDFVILQPGIIDTQFRLNLFEVSARGDE